jgi:hypothetical protein
MASRDTWAHLQAEAKRIPGVMLLPADQTPVVAARFAAAFVAVPEDRWWWNALRNDVPTATHVYGDSDALTLVGGWLPRQQRFILLVTDEEPTPAGAVSGSVADLATLIRETWHFEYVITDGDATFGIFDTHHNVLIRVGTLPS